MQVVPCFGVRAGPGRLLDRKDAANRHIHVDVGRAIERIEQQQVLAPRIFTRQLVGLLELLGHHPGDMTAPLGGTQKVIVGEHIQPLLHLALNVGVIDRAQRAAQRAGRDTLRDRLAGQRDVEDKAVELPGRVRVAAAFLDQELDERGVIGKHATRVTGCWRLAIPLLGGRAGGRRPPRYPAAAAACLPRCRSRSQSHHLSIPRPVRALVSITATPGLTAFRLA